jgi:hypothetical protein
LSAAPIDYGRFLEAHGLRPVEGPQGEVSTKLFYPFDAYMATDGIGNHFQTLIAPTEPWPVFNAWLALAEIRRVTGLPQISFWPTMCFLEEKGPPRPEQWKNAFVVATLSAQDAVKYEAGTPLDPQVLAQVTFDFMLNYTFGFFRDVHPVLVGGSVATLGLGIPLTGFESKERDSFSTYLRKRNNEARTRDVFPLPQIRSLNQTGTPAEIQKYLAHLNLLLSRLEALSEPTDETGKDYLGQLLGPVLETRDLPNYNLILPRVRARIKNIRSEYQPLLQAVAPNIAKSFPERLKLRLNSRVVNFGKYIVPWGEAIPQLTSDWRLNAKRYLWHFMMSSPLMKQKMWDLWRSQLDVDDPIQEITRGATIFDTHMYLGSEYDLAFELRNAGLTQTQWHVNQYLPQTLLVVARNDLESKKIVEVATRIQQVVNRHEPRLVIYSPDFLSEYRQGASLHMNDLDLILDEAAAAGLENIIIVELGDVTEEMRRRARQRGIAIAHVDHHNRAMRKAGSLEQIANLYNYQLSYSDFITAVLDRSGIPGLYRMGLTESEIHQHVFHRIQLERMNGLVEMIKPRYVNADGTLDYNRLTVVRTSASLRLGWVLLPLSHMMGDHIPHVIIENTNSVRFSGPLDLVDTVTQELRKEWSGRPPVRGGDMNTSYVIFRPRAPWNVANVSDRIRHIVTDHHDYTSCAVVLAGCAFDLTPAIPESH